MKVSLKRNFFSKGGVLYRATRGGHTEIPDHLREELPSDAEIVKEKAKPKAKAKAPKSDAKPEDDTPPTAGAEGEGEEGTEDKVVDFDAMNVPALKAYAKENHINLSGAQSRVDVLAAIDKGLKDKSAEVDALLGQ